MIVPRITRALRRGLTEMLVGATAGSLAVLTRANRATVDRLLAEAGLHDSDPWQRLVWLWRAGGGLLAGRLRRAAGRVFDRWVGVFRYGRLVFAVPPELTTLETRGDFLFGRYENVERRFARRYVEPDAAVLELGGCLGIVACVINQRLADPRRHVVLEPHPAIAGYLEANRKRNSCRFQIRRQVVARGDTAAFYLRDPYVGGSSMLRIEGRRIDVPSITIDRLEQETGLAFDTLVVDIEGGEAAFFAENDALLCRVRLVIVEFHPQIIGAPACEQGRDQLRAAGLILRRRCRSVEAWSRPVGGK